MEALGSRAGFAEQTQATIDTEVARMLRQAEQRAVAFLKEDRQVVDGLVDLLLTKRDPVDGSQVHALAGRSEPEVTAGGKRWPWTVASRSRGMRSPERR
jgi:cell division protease FtsH